MQSSNTNSEAQAELNARRQLRTELAAWARSILGPRGQAPAAHHLVLMRELERLSRGDIDRLMVLMPPGSAKSTYASVLFPAWWFTQHPDSAVIAASHTSDLASQFGRGVRDLVDEHGKRLGYSLVPGHRAATDWSTTTNGQYFATGVRGPITGRRADLLIIDDPVKSRAEADSKTHRDHLWDWFRSDLTTRLKPRGRITLIMTRWHEDDLGGRLLANEPGEWHTLRLPAIADGHDDRLGRAPGEALWPEWEDVAALERKRRSIGERAWSALFQQTPRPPGGVLFKANRFTYADAAPPLDGGRTVRAWDFAATSALDGGDPDWTVGLKLHRTESGSYLVLDVVRLRGSPAEVNDALLVTARADGPHVTIGIPQDPAAAGKIAVRQFAALLAGFRFVSSPEKGSKAARAEIVAAQVECGNMSILRAAWNHVFIDELSSFPLGRKDDQVDALSRAFMLLADVPEPTRRINVPLLAR